MLPILVFTDSAPPSIEEELCRKLSATKTAKIEELYIKNIIRPSILADIVLYDTHKKQYVFEDNPTPADAFQGQGYDETEAILAVSGVIRGYKKRKLAAVAVASAVKADPLSPAERSCYNKLSDKQKCSIEELYKRHKIADPSRLAYIVLFHEELGRGEWGLYILGDNLSRRKAPWASESDEFAKLAASAVMKLCDQDAADKAQAPTETQ